jgi:serine/threonine protein kinase
MLQPNQRIADFAVQRFLGRGPMSEVYLVRHVIRTTQVAGVKVFTDPRCVRRLLADAETMARSAHLQHSNIVAVIQAAPMATPPFLVSDYCPGGNLRRLIDAGPCDPADAAAILRQILAALKYAQGMGMPHGNLKPENVLLDDRAVPSRFLDEGSVKVCEFGLSRAEIGAILEAGTSIHATALNEIAPEIRQGQVPDTSADLFSCGTILFELLTGRSPQPGESPSHYNRQVTSAMDMLYQQATAPRDRRMRSIDDMLAALSDSHVPASPFGSRTVVTPADAQPAAAPMKAAQPNPLIPLESDDSPVIPLRADDLEPPAAQAEEPLELDLVPVTGDEPVAPTDHDPNFTEPIAMPDAAEEDSELIFEEAAPESDNIASPPIAPRGPSTGIDAGLLDDLSLRRPQAAPHTPAPRPPPSAIIDEIARRQIRTADALRAVFSGYLESAPLASSEIANIRIRIGQWADSQNGDDNLAANIEIARAVTSPVYRITLRTVFSPAGSSHSEPVELGSVLTAPGSAVDCTQQLTPDDYRPIIHLSTNSFAAGDFQHLEMPRLAGAIGVLIDDAEQDIAGGAIVRQELRISRAIVIQVNLIYGGSKFDLALVGNALKVVGPIKPFRRGNPSVLRRVAMALDTAQMPAALTDFRQCLDPEATPDRAEFLLGSLRRRLAQAYLAEAEAAMGVSWLESLDLISRAEALSPTESGISTLRQRVSKRELALYLVSAALIGGIFAALGGAAKPVSGPFVAAGSAALISGVFSWAILRLRFRRTLAAFCYALLFPTLIAGIIATIPDQFHDPIPDAIRGGILVIALITVVVLFKKFGNRFLGSHQAETLGGDPDAIISGIQTYLTQDWEWLAPIYMELGPMSRFVRAAEAGTDKTGGT